jgi:hypothetical protein
LLDIYAMTAFRLAGNCRAQPVRGFMSRHEFKSVFGAGEGIGAGKAGYDDRAGATLLRRTGKAARAALRGDPAETLISARRKGETPDALGRQLRGYYQTLLNEPAPERFVTLVKSFLPSRQG